MASFQLGGRVFFFYSCDARRQIFLKTIDFERLITRATVRKDGQRFSNFEPLTQCRRRPHPSCGRDIIASACLLRHGVKERRYKFIAICITHLYLLHRHAIFDLSFGIRNDVSKSSRGSPWQLSHQGCDQDYIHVCASARKHCHKSSWGANLPVAASVFGSTAEGKVWHDPLFRNVDPFRSDWDRIHTVQKSFLVSMVGSERGSQESSIRKHNAHHAQPKL
jgi:hypothetical protein